MEHYEDRFDFHGLGLAIKDAREKRGWTQEYLAELVGRTSHTIMNIENKGQYPSFGVFVTVLYGLRHGKPRRGLAFHQPRGCYGSSLLPASGQVGPR